MERWNELIAGYVLNNLTDEEQAELSAVLTKNPQLRLEIMRLRKTATMSWTQSLEWSLLNLEAGGEGWMDTADYFPNFEAEQAASPVCKAPTTTAIGSQDIEPSSPCKLRLFRYLSLTVGRKLRYSRFVLWVMALLLLGATVDSCQARRMLAIAQERILQLERATEYISDESNVSDGLNVPNDID